MIKAVMYAEDKVIIFLGLSMENQTRLVDNQPIPVKLRDLDPSLPNMDIVIMGGETEASIIEDFKALGLVGPTTKVREQ